jgi:glucose-1-phosphate cytidylyltransferase
MKAVILAGGFGTRISEETDLKPKPMIEIGGRPILWHIMKMYSKHGINDFVICCGYKGYVIKEYFSNYFLHQSDVTFFMNENKMEVHDDRCEPWTVTLVDTGDNVMTGGRLAAVRKYIKDEDAFCFTYGDGVSDIDIADSIAFHKKHGKKATVTSVYPAARFGILNIDGNSVNGFEEKPKGDAGMINGGFFVLSPEVLSLITGPECVWEQGPLKELSSSGELKAYNHDGFWQPMDTLRDKIHLEDLWSKDKAPWKTWV